MNQDELQRQLMQPDIDEHRRALNVLYDHGSHEAYGLLMFVAYNHFYPETRHLAKQKALQLQSGLFAGFQLDEPLRQEDQEAIEQLGSEDTSRQDDALQALQREHSPEDLQKLLLRLQKESDPKLTIKLIEICSRLGGDQVFAQIAPFLRSGSEQIRRTVIRSFVHFKRPEIFYLLIRFSRDGSAVVQKEALQTLQNRPVEPVLKALEKMSQPGSMALDKEACIYVITKLKLQEGLECLYRLSEDKDSLITRNAKQALQRVEGSAKAQEPVEQAAVAAAEAPQPKAEVDSSRQQEIDELCKKVESAEQAEAVQAVFALMEGGFHEAFASLRNPVWDRENKHVLATFVMALGSTRDADHGEFLVRCLTHPDGRVQANAIEALRHIGLGPHKEKILPFLESKTDRARANAITALHPFKLVDTEREIKKLLGSDRENRQLAALYILSELFEADFIPLLEIALDAPNPKVSAKAMNILSMHVYQGHKAAEDLARQWGVLEELEQKIAETQAIADEPEEEEEAEEQPPVKTEQSMDSALNELNSLPKKEMVKDKKPQASSKSGKDEDSGSIGRITNKLKNLFRKD